MDEESTQSMHLPGVWVLGSLDTSSLQIEYGMLCLFLPRIQLSSLIHNYMLNSYYVPRFVLGTRDINEKTCPILVRTPHSGWQDRLQINNFGAKTSIFQEARSNVSSQIPLLRACSTCTIHLNSYALAQPFIHCTDIY